MILKGSQRGGALKLAAHLLRQDENDHVEVHELRGFCADDLRGALQETDAVAKGTHCRQHLFSVSFNPPETENVSIGAFEEAIDQVESALGLEGQARAIVFHEKEGRRHAHVAWSRIDVEKMTAITLPFYKRKLNRVSKELFLEHGWRLPDGYRDRNRRNPLNFTLAEWQQAKRTGQDAQDLKVIFRECWSVSDNRASFERALEDQGFLLARGDRRGYVAVDWRGEVYSLSRWTGQKTKALKARIGDGRDLPIADEAKTLVAARMTDKLQQFLEEVDTTTGASLQALRERKLELREKQRSRRQELRDAQIMRAEEETRRRARRFRRGVRGAWDWMTGRTRKIKKKNEAEAVAAKERDAEETRQVIARQLEVRRELQQAMKTEKRQARKERRGLEQDLGRYLVMGSGAAEPRESGPPSGRPHRPSLHR